MKKTSVIFFLLFIWAYAAFCALEKNGSSPSVAPENSPLMTEAYRIRIPNIENGTIEVSDNKGENWKTLGRVIVPVNSVSNQGYTASRWVSDGDVAAVAVNAIHIKTDFNYQDDRGVIFNILPKESYNPDPTARSSMESAIYTNIKAGSNIFGGGYSPYVGNKISIVDPRSGKLLPIKTGFIPKTGETFLIIVERPAKYPKEIVFENRFGGLIYIKYIGEKKRYIGQVLRPVEGVGRFIGSEYTDVGRLRADHAGVICISTSPLGWVGGFQIIPSGHGMSPEMKTARTLTQWMVIGPLSALDNSFEGVAPFFRYYLQPRYSENDIDQPDWKKRLLERFLVEVKYKDKEGWQLMPVHPMDAKKPLPRYAGTAMEEISHIRILFPIYQ